MISPIQALDEVCQVCSRNEPLPDHLSDWLAGALGRFLSLGCENLNEAFGIQQGHGGIPWWRERAIRTRDEAIRELGRVHFRDLAPSARTREIHRLTRRYAGTAWPRDREREDMPSGYAGTPKQFVWMAFKSGAKMPVSDRHLRTLLSGLDEE